MSYFHHSHEHLHRTTYDTPEVVHEHRHAHREYQPTPDRANHKHEHSNGAAKAQAAPGTNNEQSTTPRRRY